MSSDIVVVGVVVGDVSSPMVRKSKFMREYSDVELDESEIRVRTFLPSSSLLISSNEHTGCGECVLKRNLVSVQLFDSVPVAIVDAVFVQLEVVLALGDDVVRNEHIDISRPRSLARI